MFIDDDGTYELSTYGSVDRNQLQTAVERLAAS